MTRIGGGNVEINSISWNRPHKTLRYISGRQEIGISWNGGPYILDSRRGMLQDKSGVEMLLCFMSCSCQSMYDYIYAHSTYVMLTPHLQTGSSDTRIRMRLVTRGSFLNMENASSSLIADEFGNPSKIQKQFSTACQSQGVKHSSCGRGEIQEFEKTWGTFTAPCVHQGKKMYMFVAFAAIKKCLFNDCSTCVSSLIYQTKKSFFHISLLDATTRQPIVGHELTRVERRGVCSAPSLQRVPLASTPTLSWARLSERPRRLPHMTAARQ